MAQVIPAPKRRRERPIQERVREKIAKQDRARESAAARASNPAERRARAR